MRYQVRVGETFVEIEVTPTGQGHYQVNVGGHSYEVALERSGPEEAPVYSLLLEGETVNFHAQGSPGALEILLGGELLQVEVSRGGAVAGTGLPGDLGPLSIRAVMPGLVREVYVHPDEIVQRGSRLLVLEAMKMNNEIRAPRPGVIQAVRVAAGQRVDKGEVLLVIA